MVDTGHSSRRSQNVARIEEQIQALKDRGRTEGSSEVQNLRDQIRNITNRRDVPRGAPRAPSTSSTSGNTTIITRSQAVAKAGERITASDIQKQRNTEIALQKGQLASELKKAGLSDEEVHTALTKYTPNQINQSLMLENERQRRNYYQARADGGIPLVVREGQEQRYLNTRNASRTLNGSSINIDSGNISRNNNYLGSLDNRNSSNFQIFAQNNKGTLQEVKRPEGFLKGSIYDLEQFRSRQIANQQQNNANSVFAGALVFGSSVIIEPLRAASFGQDIIKSPKSTITNTIRGTSQFAKTFATSPVYREYLGKEIYANPASTAGSIVGNIATGYGSSKLFNFGVNKAKDAYVVVGSKYVPKESVFADSVLAGKETLPTTKSIKESLNRFSQSDEVITSSPAKITGDTVGIGKKAAKGIEDPGIYVTPAGQGSPYFLGIKAVNTEYSFSLNPFKGALDLPTVTKFKILGVQKYPRSVVNSPGFEQVTKYQQQNIGKGLAYITKRSEIGQGDLPRQTFFNKIQNTVQRERGTTEIEAVIPIESTFRYNSKSILGRLKGFDSYTIINGRAIPLRDAEILLGNSKNINSAGQIELSGSQLAKESSTSYRYGNPSSRIYPYGFAASTLSSFSNFNSKSRLGSSNKSNVSSSSEFGSSLKQYETSQYKGVSYGYGYSLFSRSYGQYNQQSRYSGYGQSYNPYSSTSYTPKPLFPTPPKPKKRKNNDFVIQNSIFSKKISSKNVYRYTPTAFSLALNVRGKGTKAGEISGLGIRPIR